MHHQEELRIATHRRSTEVTGEVRAAVTRTSETIPVTDGELHMGTWQGLFLFEHREVPHTRVLVVHVHGE